MSTPIGWFPPMTRTLDPVRFEGLIKANGIKLYWLKSHACPCMYAGDTPGNAQPGCLTCHGRGVYWDGPVGPFTGLITFIHTSPTPDEPGARMDEDVGMMVNGEPALTITNDAASSGIWRDAKLYDQFVEVEALNVFNANLRSGYQTAVPYQQKLSIPPTGAVTVWDTTTSSVVTGVSYAVSGTNVILSSGYPIGTNFTVEFTAAPAYVAYRVAGMPAHVRPFAGLNQPRRFRLQNLDLFTRAKFAGDIPFVP